MATVAVYGIYCSKPVIEKEEHDLLWYDPELKTMHKFKGGRLMFVRTYDDKLKKYRMLPKVEDVEKKSNISGYDLDKVSEWFKRYSNTFSSDVGIDRSDKANGYVEFDVPHNELSRFRSELEDEGFAFSIWGA